MPIFGWEDSVIKSADGWPHSGPLYSLMFWASDFSKVKWIVLAILILVISIKGWRKIIAPVVLGTIAAGLGDLVSRRVVKVLVMRPRPHYVGLDCSMSSCWGFVSSHSTNVAAAVTILCIYDRRNLLWGIPTLLLVCVSRIYLVDHFPLDVIGGMVLGALIGIGIYKIYKFILMSKGRVFNPRNKLLNETRRD